MLITVLGSHSYTVKKFRFMQQSTVAVCVGGRETRRSCLPGLRRGGGGRQAGATVLSCRVWCGGVSYLHRKRQSGARLSADKTEKSSYTIASTNAPADVRSYHSAIEKSGPDLSV